MRKRIPKARLQATKTRKPARRTERLPLEHEERPAAGETAAGASAPPENFQ